MSSLTKILIVLQLVFSLVLAVLVVFGVSHIENYRSQVKAANDGLVAAQVVVAKVQNESNAKDVLVSQANAKAASASAEWQQKNGDLHNQLTQSEIAKNTAEARVAQLLTSINQLTSTTDSLKSLLAEKDKEINSIRPDMVNLTQKNAELNRANNELSTANRFAEQAIRKLQEQIASAPEGKTGSAAPVVGGNDAQVASLSAAPASTPINAKVTNIAQTAGRTLIELPLGDRDGIKVGSKLAIYRNSGYVGDAVVDRVTADQSVAAVVALKPGETVQVGDLVASGLGQ